jgi:hypothetical protein
MKWLIPILLIAATTVAACKTVAQTAPERSVLVAKQACEIDALAQEKNEMATTLSVVTDRVGKRVEKGSTQRYTILAQKLQQSSGEVEASYRFVTANCNSYNLCMAENHFDERMCMGTRNAWQLSHERFNQLAVELKEIENWPDEVIVERVPEKKPCDRCRPLPPSDCRAVKCNVQGAVFSTGCCYDGD